jgi:probable F420-dependent oxidoreductase
MVALSMVAVYSERLKFGTSVLALPLRNPVVLAKQIATLDYLSRGRCFPAVGLGQEDPREYEACGVPKTDRGRRTDEAIVLMRRLWQEDRVTHEGEFFTCHDVSITPKPVFQPSPPVWIGGRSRAAARRVGRVGDGWLVSRATPDEVREGCDIVFDTAADCNRRVEDDHIGVLLGCYISSDGPRALAKAEPYVTRNRPDVSFTAYSAVGSADQVAEMIQQYIDAGASKFVVRPLCPGHEAMQQLAIMGEEIIPVFHPDLSEAMP